MATFAERFNEALHLRHITAAEISRLLNIPEATLSQYKKGLYEPKQVRLMQLAQVLNVPIGWLMGLTDDLNDGQSAKALLIEKIENLPEERVSALNQLFDLWLADKG